MSDDTFPHSLEAERATIGGVMVDPGRLLDVPWLQPAHFYRIPHQDIWRAMLALGEQGREIDVVTLSEALRGAGRLDRVGGAAYLSQLVDGVPRASNVAHYAAVVREQAALRAIVHAGETMAAKARTAREDARQVLAEAEQAIYAIGQGTATGELVPAADAIGGVMQRFEALLENRTGITGLPTGFADLDRLTRGLQPKTLVILAARPSMGKSAMAMNIAAHVVEHVGEPVAFFSLEMSRDELLFRQVVATARVNGTRVLGGHVNQTEYQALSHAFGVIGQTPLWIDETADTTVLEIRSKARRLKARAGLGLVIVDYLQLLGSSQRAENRTLEVAAMTRGFKQLAKELDVPVVVLSQLNRDLERRGEKRPTLADLRDSGAIEQDADLVLFLYRDEVYNPNTQDVGIAEVQIAKQRNGPTGTVRLRWSKEMTRFDNLEYAR